MAGAQHVDVAIVGGGHNGLTAAAYLAAAGRSCVVLERSAAFGGAAVSERPFAGIDARLSRYAYLVSLLPASIVRDLGLEREVRLARRSVASYTPDPRPGAGCWSTRRIPPGRARRSRRPRAQIASRPRSRTSTR